MKKKTQMERFMDYEVAIKVNNSEEFYQLMNVVRGMDKNIMLSWEFMFGRPIIKRNDKTSLIRYTEVESSNYEFTIEDFKPFEKSHQPRVLVNGNATIVWFEDGDKVVVKHTDDLPYDQEKAIAMACAKKLLGGYSKFQELLDLVEGEASNSDEKFAIVIDNGCLYSTYTNFFTKEFEKYKDRYVTAENIIYTSHEKLHHGEKVKIIGERNGLFVIEPSNKKGVYLIGEQGLKFL